MKKNEFNRTGTGIWASDIVLKETCLMQWLLTPDASHINVS